MLILGLDPLLKATLFVVGPATVRQSCLWVGLTHGLGWVHHSKSTKKLKGLF